MPTETRRSTWRRAVLDSLELGISAASSSKGISQRFGSCFVGVMCSSVIFGDNSLHTKYSKPGSATVGTPSGVRCWLFAVPVFYTQTCCFLCAICCV